MNAHAPLVSSTRAGAALIHEGHPLRAAHVADVETLELEAGAFDEIRNRPVEMAASADAFPRGRDAILPPAHLRVRRQPMLDEEEAAPGPKHAAHFGERTARIGDAAERPGRHYGVHAPGIKRQRFCGALISSIALLVPLPARRAIASSRGDGSSPITCCARCA